MKKYVPHEIFDVISDRIRAGAKLRDMNIAELADQLNIDPASLYRSLKQGNGIATPRLVEIANILELPISYFFGDIQIEDYSVNQNNSGNNNIQFGTNSGTFNNNQAFNKDNIESQIIEMLEYAPNEFKEKLLERLNEFKRLSTF